MRTHGWAGRPPKDDAEARARILAVTRARLAEAGSTSTSDVAERLGVTRQTVYRYFPTTDDLLNAAAIDAVGELTDGLLQHVRREHDLHGGDAGDAVVEVVAYVYEHLRDDPALNRLLAPGRISTTLAGLTAPSSIAIGRSLLAGFPIDWEASGLDADAQVRAGRAPPAHPPVPGPRPRRPGAHRRASCAPTSSAGSRRRCGPWP